MDFDKVDQTIDISQVALKSRNNIHQSEWILEEKREIFRVSWFWSHEKDDSNGLQKF